MEEQEYFDTPAFEGVKICRIGDIRRLDQGHVAQASWPQPPHRATARNHGRRNPDTHRAAARIERFCNTCLARMPRRPFGFDTHGLERIMRATSTLTPDRRNRQAALTAMLPGGGQWHVSMGLKRSYSLAVIRDIMERQGNFQ